MRLLWAVAALALLSLPQCTPGGQPVSGLIGCEDDSDCASDQLCRESRCARAQLDEVGLCTQENAAQACGVGAYCDVDNRCAELPLCEGGCPEGLRCNDATGQCVLEPTCEDCCSPGSCDDGRFCNGAEACNAATGQCEEGTPACAGSSPQCDEAARTCRCADDGDCEPPEVCGDGVCGCTPQCDGRQCGGDGCGGSCGACSDSEVCTEGGQCECVPECGAATCGSDGCDGSCGSCSPPESCEGGACVCTPDCDGKDCGDDGCGDSCGTCPAPESCAPNGECGCVSDCDGRVCGDDGCGGSCGTCPTGACGLDGQCGCTPDCSGKQCGDDGCGGSCGSCGAHQGCTVAGACANTGVVCDVLTDTVTLSEYQSRSGALTAGFDAEYMWDSRPYRVLDDYPLGAPAGSTVQLDMTSTELDPVLYVYDVAGGSCSQVARDDDSGPGNAASLAITLGGGSYRVVTTSYAELATGRYSLASRVDLCGLEVAPDVYAKCKDPVTAAECSNNPCIPDSSPEFCCVTQACRDGYGVQGATMMIFESAPVCGP